MADISMLLYNGVDENQDNRRREEWEKYSQPLRVSLLSHGGKDVRAATGLIDWLRSPGKDRQQLMLFHVSRLFDKYSNAQQRISRAQELADAARAGGRRDLFIILFSGDAAEASENELFQIVLTSFASSGVGGVWPIVRNYGEFWPEWSVIVNCLQTVEASDGIRDCLDRLVRSINCPSTSTDLARSVHLLLNTWFAVYGLDESEVYRQQQEPLAMRWPRKSPERILQRVISPEWWREALGVSSDELNDALLVGNGAFFKTHRRIGDDSPIIKLIEQIYGNGVIDAGTLARARAVFDASDITGVAIK